MSRVTSTSPTPRNASEMLGDVQALASTLRSAGDAVWLEASAPPLPARLDSMAAWREYVDPYLAEVLVPREWPFIVRAHGYACQGMARELIAADREWSQSRSTLPSAWGALGEASSRVGQRQLNRLRPLRDQRIVQRYVAAVEAGDAQGWHPLVYGVVVAAFAIPLRQGLQHYARQTLAGLLAGTPLATRLTEPARTRLLDDMEQSLVPELLRVLPEGIAEGF